MKKDSPSFSLTKKEFWLITLGFIFWRIIIALIAIYAGEILPDSKNFHYFNLAWEMEEKDFSTTPGEKKRAWSEIAFYQVMVKTASFDGSHYLNIVNLGYAKINFVQAFFPLYPLSIKLIYNLTGFNPLYIALMISNLSTWGFCLLFYQLLKNNFSARTAQGALLGLALWPASFYLGMVYSEGLFLFLLVLAIILYQKKKWWFLAPVLILLTATRIIGIVLVATLILNLLWRTFIWPKIQNWQNNHWSDKKTVSKKSVDKSIKISSIHPTQSLITSQKMLKKEFWPAIFSLIIGCLGLIGYMIFLKIRFNDPFYFMSVQSSFGAGRETNQLVLLPQVFWRYIKIISSYIMTGQGLNLNNWPYWQELWLSLIAGLVIVWEICKLIKIYFGSKKSSEELSSQSETKTNLLFILTIFSLGAYLVPTLTGILSSMPRYLLACLIIFVWFGDLKPRSKSAQAIWLLIALSLLAFNIMLFTQGYWVA